MVWLYLVAALLQPAPSFSGPQGFDFFLGAWQAKQSWLQDDLTRQAFTNRVHVTKLLQGCGVQDDNFKPEDGGEVYFGTALRVYDPANQRWICRWFDGRKHQLGPDFYLKASDGGFAGTIDGEDHHGKYRDHIQFFDITPNQFQWKMIRRYQGLDRDFLVGEITYTRIK